MTEVVPKYGPIDTRHRTWSTMVAYAITVGLPAVLLVVMVAYHVLTNPPPPPGAAAPSAGASTTATFLTALLVIVGTARLFGSVAERLGQPRVVGEILAGIALGPSALGLLPGATAMLFPEQISGYLDSLAQIGLVLFMFAVGVELDPSRAGGRGTSLVLGHACVAVPTAIGAGLGWMLYPRLAPPGVGLLPFALFFGIALGITAFPVLARILNSRGMAGSQEGALALAGAAIADITAWCLLAVVISLVGDGSVASSMWRIGSLVLFCALVFTLVRPALRMLLRSRLSDSGVLIILTSSAMLAALITELIGMHTIFGAFLLGVMVPHDSPRAARVVHPLDAFCLAFLLPVFFTQFGLSFRLGEIGLDPGLWGWCGVIIVVATIGKLGGSVAALRLCGRGWQESALVGTLMNCRGLTELVVLNIGLTLHLLSTAAFTMLAIMALFTTILTGPLITLFHRPAQVRTSSVVGVDRS